MTGDHLDLKVPADKVDDFLKSLTVVDARTGKPAPVSYPTKPATAGGTGLIDMRLGLSTPTTHRLKLSYVTESPSWKPSYRVMLDKGGKVNLEAWAIVDNTSGEDWNQVRLGVGSSSALSFRFDLQSIRLVERETLQPNSLIAIAPPMGDSTYGTPRTLVAELDESEITDAPADANGSPKKSAPGRGGAHARMARAAAVSAAAPPMDADKAMKDGLAGQTETQFGAVDALAQRVKQSATPVTIEGFASSRDDNKEEKSLERANHLRAQLVARGVDPSKVVAVGRGLDASHEGGVRLVESPVAMADKRQTASNEMAAKPGDPLASEPIGTSSFESGNVTSVARGSSAMVSVLHGSTEGEVVYLFRPRERARQRAVRLQERAPQEPERLGARDRPGHRLRRRPLHRRRHERADPGARHGLRSLRARPPDRGRAERTARSIRSVSWRRCSAESSAPRSSIAARSTTP